MFCDLGLLAFNTMIYNAQVRPDSSVDVHNRLMNLSMSSMFFAFVKFSVLSVLYIVCFCPSVCRSVYLCHCFSTSLSLFVGHVA